MNPFTDDQPIVGCRVRLSDKVAVKYYLVRTDSDEAALNAVRDAGHVFNGAKINIMRAEGGELADMKPNEIKETNVVS
jgi:hypothetical protein